jgi:hypothetical protein
MRTGPSEGNLARLRTVRAPPHPVTPSSSLLRARKASFASTPSAGLALREIAKELDRFFVGAETEEEYAELAGRSIGAAERDHAGGDSSYWRWEPAAWPVRHRREAIRGWDGYGHNPKFPMAKPPLYALQ